MSTQITGASAKVLFESPAQLKLKKKLLAEGNFEIVSSGPESATNLDKGITVVRTKQLVGRHPITDEPIYEFKEFPIAHPRENIADVFRRRLPRDAKGGLTLPALTEATMADLNAALEDYNIYLEPSEFTITKQGAAAYHVTAKNNCVIFYGKISITNTNAVQAPQEVYSVDGEEVEVETPVTPPSEGGSSNESGSGASEVTLTDVIYNIETRVLIGLVSGASEVTVSTDAEGAEAIKVVVVNNAFAVELDESVVEGTILTVTAGDKSVEIVAE